MNKKERKIFARIATALEHLVTAIERHPEAPLPVANDSTFDATDSWNDFGDFCRSDTSDESAVLGDIDLDDDFSCSEIEDYEDSYVPEEYAEILDEALSDQDSYYRSEEEGWYYNDDDGNERNCLY
jgi:hypothetical protein